MTTGKCARVGLSHAYTNYIYIVRACVAWIDSHFPSNQGPVQLWTVHTDTHTCNAQRNYIAIMINKLVVVVGARGVRATSNCMQKPPAGSSVRAAVVCVCECMFVLPDHPAPPAPSLPRPSSKWHRQNVICEWSAALGFNKLLAGQYSMHCSSSINRCTKHSHCVRANWRWWGYSQYRNASSSDWGMVGGREGCMGDGVVNCWRWCHHIGKHRTQAPAQSA